MSAARVLAVGGQLGAGSPGQGRAGHLGRRAERRHGAGGVDEEHEDAEHAVDDDGVDVAAHEGGLQAARHGVQDDAHGDEHGRLGPQHSWHAQPQHAQSHSPGKQRARWMPGVTP